jgi:hypothetical protein
MKTGTVLDYSPPHPSLSFSTSGATSSSLLHSNRSPAPQPHSVRRPPFSVSAVPPADVSAFPHTQPCAVPSPSYTHQRKQDSPPYALGAQLFLRCLRRRWLRVWRRIRLYALARRAALASGDDLATLGCCITAVSSDLAIVAVRILSASVSSMFCAANAARRTRYSWYSFSTIEISLSPKACLLVRC